MHNISGIDSFTDPYQVIDDSDPPNASNFNTPHQAEANRTQYLRNRLGFGPSAASNLGYLLRAVFPSLTSNTGSGWPRTVAYSVAVTTPHTWFNTGYLISTALSPSAPFQPAAGDIIISWWSLQMNWTGTFASGVNGEVFSHRISRSLAGGAGPFTALTDSQRDQLMLPSTSYNPIFHVNITTYDIVPTAATGTYGQRLEVGTDQSTGFTANVMNGTSVHMAWFSPIT